MKTIALLWFIAAVVQITTSAPASDVLSMDVTELAEYFIQNTYHNYDDQTSVITAVLKSVIAKLDDIIANHDDTNTTKEIEIYEQIRNNFTEYLKDLQNDTIIKECGIQLVSFYYHENLMKSIKDETENVKKFVESFTNKLDEGIVIVKHDKNYYKIFGDELLMKEMRKRTKLNTVCCKFSNKSFGDVVFDGEC